MAMEMPKITNCNVHGCAYNMDDRCHAIAITVGGGECAFCDTAFIMGAKKGGLTDINGGVGACKMDICSFNNSLECTAKGINVRTHTGHAECGTFNPQR